MLANIKQNYRYVHQIIKINLRTCHTSISFCRGRGYQLNKNRKSPPFAKHRKRWAQFGMKISGGCLLPFPSKDSRVSFYASQYFPFTWAHKTPREFIKTQRRPTHFPTNTYFFFSFLLQSALSIFLNSLFYWVKWFSAISFSDVGGIAWDGLGQNPFNGWMWIVKWRVKLCHTSLDRVK